MSKGTQHISAGSKHSSLSKILGTGSHPLSFINVINIAMHYMRTIFKKNPRENSVPFFKTANVLPIPELYTHRISIYAHDIFYNNPTTTLAELILTFLFYILQ